MIRFIHAADPHLDSPLEALEAHEGAPVDILRGATRRAFENLVALAIEERVHFLLIAGDLYDGDWKDHSTGLFFRRQMVRLMEKGIPVYLIAGNHDAASVISKKLDLPANVHVFSTRAAESMQVDGVAVIIHGRGFPNRAVPENLVADYPPAAPGLFNIGLLHTSLTGRPGHDPYAPCLEADLRDKKYGYWALGHIHQPEVISKNPWIVFAGNCQGRHVRETGARGCRLVTVNDSLEVDDAEWRSLDVVRWQILEINIAGLTEETQALDLVAKSMGDAVREADGRLVAARIIFTGATPLHGYLHRDPQHWRAQVLARAQDHGEAALWIERIKVDTSPVYDLAQLAGRDALTRIVIETMDHTRIDAANLPAEISEMLEVIPVEIRQHIEAQWAEDSQAAMLGEVRAIVLDALGTKGGPVT